MSLNLCAPLSVCMLTFSRTTHEQAPWRWSSWLLALTMRHIRWPMLDWRRRGPRSQICRVMLATLVCDTRWVMCALQLVGAHAQPRTHSATTVPIDSYEAKSGTRPQARSDEGLYTLGRQRFEIFVQHTGKLPPDCAVAL